MEYFSSSIMVVLDPILLHKETLSLLSFPGQWVFIFVIMYSMFSVQRERALRLFLHLCFT